MTCTDSSLELDGLWLKMADKSREAAMFNRDGTSNELTLGTSAIAPKFSRSMSDKSILIAPSILACDFGRLHDEVRRAEAAGADWLHLDVMDGHFVDNISFGPAFCDAAARVATVPLDVHLMIDRPDHFLPRFTKIAHNITVHVEAMHDIELTLARIREAGCTCGISLRPHTPFSEVECFLDRVDLLLVMTVEPGFGGQPFMPEMLSKISAAAQVRRERGLKFRIQVDGGINANTAAQTIAAGADTLVAGTSVFGAQDMAAAIKEMRAPAGAGL